MPFTDTPEGQTHYYGDGCPEHPMQTPDMKEWEAELERIMTPPKYHESMGENCICCGWPMPNSEGHMMMRDFIRTLLHQTKQQTIVECLDRLVSCSPYCEDPGEDCYAKTRHALITYAKERGIKV